jgi:hypothetical protein
MYLCKITQGHQLVTAWWNCLCVAEKEDVVRSQHGGPPISYFQSKYIQIDLNKQTLAAILKASPPNTSKPPRTQALSAYSLECSFKWAGNLWPGINPFSFPP